MANRVDPEEVAHYDPILLELQFNFFRISSGYNVNNCSSRLPFVINRL